MKKVKNKIFYICGIIMVLSLSIVSINFISGINNKSLNSEFVYELSNKNYRKVYMLDETNMLVPLTIEINRKQHLVDEIYTVISNLRDLKIDGFNNVLSDDIKINKIELKDGILNIDFSKEFLNYDKLLEEKILESLTWSVLEFEEINGLRISVEGQLLKTMPLNGYVLPDILDKSIGINKYHEMITRPSDSSEIVFMYSKTVGENEYYIPVTRLVKNDEVSFSDIYKKDVSVLSGLKKIDYLKGIEKIEINEENFNVSIDESYLLEDNLVDKELYEILAVMLYYNNYDYIVNFFIDEEAVEVSGYNKNEEINVSAININTIEI